MRGALDSSGGRTGEKTAPAPSESAERIRAESRFRAALDASLDAFLLVEAVRESDGRIEDFTVRESNSRFADLLGLPREAVIGRRVSRLVPALALLGVIGQWARALERRQSLVEEMHVESADLRAQDIHQHAVPCGDGLAITMRDLTERRRLERQLVQSQKMEGLGRLAGGVAHDFNNLLTVIRGYAEMAAQTVGDNDIARAHIELVQKAASRASGLTAKLLTIARRSAVEMRKVEADRLVFELEPILQRVVGENVILVLEPSVTPAWVEADPGSLGQVLLQLASNARDAMPDGGTLRMSVETVEVNEEAALLLHDARSGTFVRISVVDNGCGMTDEALAHLFEPFFTTKKTGHGAGLGLATTYGIVRQADGFIGVDSALGKGTTVTIHLPVSTAPEVREARTPPELAALRGGETILVVEDEPNVRRFLCEALRTGGYRVLEAAQGNDALVVSRAHEGEIQLLLSDVVMPGFRGPELAALLSAERMGLRVLYVSGWTESFDGLGAGDGKPALLEKPFTITALLSKVREVLDSATFTFSP